MYKSVKRVEIVLTDILKFELKIARGHVDSVSR